MNVSGFSEQESVVKRLVKEGRFDDARDVCGEIMAETPAERAEVSRLRAYTYALQGRHESAFMERRSIVDSGMGQAKDYYQMGYDLISKGDFRECIEWFEKTISVEEEQGTDWFTSASSLLLSFSGLQLGRLDFAKKWLEITSNLEPDCAMPVEGYGMITIDSLRSGANFEG